jgi:hypothetical protein
MTVLEDAEQTNQRCTQSAVRIDGLYSKSNAISNCNAIITFGALLR